MAKSPLTFETQLQEHVNKIVAGKITNSSDFREKARLLKINVLQLKAKEVTLLENLLEGVDSAGTGGLAEIKGALEGARDLGGGAKELEPLVLDRLSKIGDMLGKTRETGYELGHVDISSFIQNATLVREMYKSAESKKTASVSQVMAINKLIALAQVIDRAAPEAVRKAIKGKPQANSQDLLDLLAPINTFTVDLQASTDLIVELGKGKKGKARVTYEFEDKTDNQNKGFFTKILGTKLRSFIKDPTKLKKDVLASEIDRLFKNVDWSHVRSSPSLKGAMGTAFDRFFINEVGYKVHIKSKYSKKEKLKINNNEIRQLKSAITSRVRHLKTKINAQKHKKKFVMPTLTLKALINESLALFIKNRMGDSGDPAIKLRYQTGTFSRSAKLLTLNRVEAGMYLGTYGFEENPYNVFLPGGRLHTQQRDPRIYIEGAIRDIAIQVLNRNFNGINLRLV